MTESDDWSWKVMPRERRIESKVKGEPEEAAAEIEAGGRRKEIADETATKLCGYGRETLVERLWERSEVGRKETNSEAKYKNRD